MWNKSTVLLLCSNFRPSGFLLIFSSPHAKFSELKAGNYKQMVQTRLLWSWEARTHRRLYAPPWSKGDSSLSLDDFGFVYWFRKLVFRWFWFCLSLIRQSISHTNHFRQTLQDWVSYNYGRNRHVNGKICLIFFFFFFFSLSYGFSDLRLSHIMN